MHESHLFCHKKLFQLHLDRNLSATFYMLEEPSFDTLRCNENVLQLSPVHLSDFFQTHKAHCYLCQCGEHVCSQLSPLLFFCLAFLMSPWGPKFSNWMTWIFLSWSMTGSWRCHSISMKVWWSSSVLFVICCRKWWIPAVPPEVFLVIDLETTVHALMLMSQICLFADRQVCL